jgi:hypothetical protein
MKNLAGCCLPAPTAKTTPNLKLRKSIQLPVQDFADIHHTFKFQRAKPTPDACDSTDSQIPPNPETGKSGSPDLELNANAISNNPPSQHGFMPNLNQRNFFDTRDRCRELLLLRYKREVQLAEPAHPESRAHSSKKPQKHLPKIEARLSRLNSSPLKPFYPLLSSFDEALKAIKTLHYFIM